MESITFADVLFTVIVLVITFGILYFVNKAKNNKTPSADQSAEASAQSSEKASS